MVMMTRSAKGLRVLDLTCKAAPTVVGQVRLLIEYRMAEWGMNTARYAEVRADLYLIATELVTNAVEETPDGEIRIRCIPHAKARVIRLAVWDSSDRKPEVISHELTLETLDLNPQRYDDNGGWGLPLVLALSDKCGVEPTKDGKWVWADIRVGQ